MLTLLRWNDGDADEIAPSLYAGRTRSRADDDTDTGAPVTGPTPTTNPIPPGMPGSDPFRA